MQRIIFVTLVFCFLGFVSKAQTQPPVPPKRTSDPAAFHTKAAASLQMKSGGGGATTHSATNAVMPLRTSNGGSGSGSTTGRQPVGLAGAAPQNQSNSKPLRPSDMAVKQDSTVKH